MEEVDASLVEDSDLTATVADSDVYDGDASSEAYSSPEKSRPLFVVPPTDGSMAIRMQNMSLFSGESDSGADEVLDESYTSSSSQATLSESGISSPEKMAFQKPGNQHHFRRTREQPKIISGPHKRPGKLALQDTSSSPKERIIPLGATIRKPVHQVEPGAKRSPRKRRIYSATQRLDVVGLSDSSSRHSPHTPDDDGNGGYEVSSRDKDGVPGDGYRKSITRGVKKNLVDFNSLFFQSSDEDSKKRKERGPCYNYLPKDSWPAAFTEDLSAVDQSQVLSERNMDGHLDHKYMVMILDETVDEGEEFLMYHYPSDNPVAERLLGMKGVFSVLDSAIKTVCGQKIETAVFEEAVDHPSKPTHQTRFKAHSIEMDGWAKGYMFVLITWAPVPDLVLVNMASSLLDLTHYCAGPIHRNFFDDEEEQRTLNHTGTKPRYQTCIRAMRILDPIYRLCAATLFKSDEQTLFLQSFGRGVMWFQPSLDVSHLISERLTALACSTYETNSNHGFEPLCVVIGSTLYHKGRIVASQMSPVELKTSTTLCQLHRLLGRDSSSPLFVTSFAVYTDAGCVHEETGLTIPSRRVLVVVCIGHAVLSVFLAPRAESEG